jgi:hypothetical protein
MRIIQMMLICFIAWGVFSCQLQKDLDIDLPPAPKNLIVESYLIPGEPVRLLLTETVDYLDDVYVPYVNDAKVIISSKHTTDTLSNSFILHKGITYSYSPSNSEVINYSSQKIKPSPNEEYTLKIIDSKGRTVTAKATFQPVVPIDSVIVTFDKDSLANLTIHFFDDPDTENYYRILIGWSPDHFHRDMLLDDKVSNGGLIHSFSGYSYDVGDNLYVKLFHLSKAHYQFLKSLGDAQSANSNNPFAQPTRIVSNVEGGIGIFTGLSYDEKAVRIK